MSSVDLTAAFDSVDVRLLVVRLYNVGLPIDVIKLIELWLSGRLFFVSVDGNMYPTRSFMWSNTRLYPWSNFLHHLRSSTFKLAKLTNLTGDNFIIQLYKLINILCRDMEAKLETITKWLKNYCLRVNASKTKVCLFHRRDCQSVTMNVNNSPIRSQNSINVLGVIFHAF
jgi:hypothetical protein